MWPPMAKCKIPTNYFASQWQHIIITILILQTTPAKLLVSSYSTACCCVLVFVSMCIAIGTLHALVGNRNIS